MDAQAILFKRALRLDSCAHSATSTPTMALTEYASVLAPELLAAIERKGYSELTAVQLAVLDETLSGRDLRITSQTGSGKTIAIGLILRSVAFQPASVSSGIARPRALVIAPTRELAHQVEQE